MIMKRLYTVLMMLALAVGQVSAAGLSQQQMVQAVQEASASISSMKCAFVQTKHTPLMEQDAVSNGRMVYASPSRLKWEYTAPESWCLTVDGEKVSLGGVESEGPQSRLYQGIGSMMLNCMNGNCLTDRRMFTVSMMESDNVWTAVLTPVRSDLKRLFKTITLEFGSKDRLLQKIMMVEQSGGWTEIKISDVQTGGNYDSEW